MKTQNPKDKIYIFISDILTLRQTIKSKEKKNHVSSQSESKESKVFSDSLINDQHPSLNFIVVTRELTEYNIKLDRLIRVTDNCNFERVSVSN